MTPQILEPVLISAIEHYSYCPRQCGLIHVESIYEENLFTLRGSGMHKRVHEQTVRAERGATVLRGLPVWSDEHGLVGQCDAVELSPLPSREAQGEGAVGRGFSVRPIEYKVGRDVGAPHAALQAVAQAMCLSEMLGVAVPDVAVFYGATKTRKLYEITEDLERQVLYIADAIRQMRADGSLAEPVADKRCRKCSLIDTCQPFAVRAAAHSRADDLFKPRKEAPNLP